MSDNNIYKLTRLAMPKLSILDDKVSHDGKSKNTLIS